MIVALALMLQAAAAVDDEIVVLARKLESISVWVAPNAQGKLACSMKQSSGNSKMDAKLCETAASCVKQGAVGNDAVKDCIDKRKPDLLRAVAINLRAGRS